MTLYTADDVMKHELEYEQFVAEEFDEWLSQIGAKGFSCTDINDVMSDIRLDLEIEGWSLNMYLLINFKGIRADSMADLKAKLTAAWDTYIDIRLDQRGGI